MHDVFRNSPNNNDLIPDVWPSRRKSSATPPLYDIFLNRMAPRVTFENSNDLWPLDILDAKPPVSCYPIASAAEGKWYYQLPGEKADEMIKMEEGVFLAIWRDPRASDILLHLWEIPMAVMKGVLTRLKTAEGTARNVVIRIPTGSARSKGWSLKLRDGGNEIPVNEYHIEWKLNEAEMKHIKDARDNQIIRGGEGETQFKVTPHSVWANDPIVSPAMRALGVARGTFDRSVRRDSRLEQLFREEKWEELVSVFKGREEPKRTKRQLKKDLSELYSEVSAGDSFVRDNFSAKKLQNLLLEKQKKPRLQKVQEALQDSYKRQEYSEMLETIKGYLRTVPRIILPIIWKEFVKPVVPEWNYESFSNIVKTNKLIMAAIATNEEGEIKRFVEVYRSKFEKGSFYRPR